MKIKVFNTCRKNGSKDFRMEVEGVIIIDICNQLMTSREVDYNFCRWLSIPRLLERVFKQGQKLKEKDGTITIETNTVEYH